MKNILIILLAISLTNCGGDDDGVQNCDFIGTWCLPVLGSCEDSPTVADIEFRANGEFLEGILAGRTWESSDCMTIELFSSLTDQKIEEYTLISLVDDVMVLDRGFGNTTYNRR
jgi:hypothetical protein